MERRLTAILAADIVGYSLLMGEDEAATLKALKMHKAELIDPKTAQYNGRIIKLMGDGVLMEFGSVVDAVTFAIEIQNAMVVRNSAIPGDRQIVYRIGINIGDIIVEGGDIYGDGVNVAARLEQLADPGGICVARNVFNQVKNKISANFQDMGEHKLKNISEPVHAYRVVLGDEKVVQPDPYTSERPELPDKPSIAALPFLNLSDDPEQEFFADGMTEDIITELSRFENLFVISRHTSLIYKGQQVDAKAVAHELGVHFILQGSVRKTGGRVRITAQLINGQDGSHVWAERYDGALEDVFDLQEQVTGQVVASIAPHVADAEMEQIGRGERMFGKAQELAWRALETSRSALRARDPPMLDRAIAMAIEAVELDAKCSVAYQTISYSYSMQSLLRWGDDPSAAADLAERWAEKFFSQLPQSYMAHHCLGFARFRKGLYQDADRDFRRAHELNPNDPIVLRFWAWCEATAGDFESAKKHAHMANRLSPKDTWVHVSYLALAMAAFIEKDGVGFEDWAGKAIQLAPHNPIRRAMMIAYAAETGDQALLKTHRAELMRSAPDFINSLFRGEHRVFQKPEHMAMLLDGLRKAGFPK